MEAPTYRTGAVPCINCAFHYPVTHPEAMQTSNNTVFERQLFQLDHSSMLEWEDLFLETVNYILLSIVSQLSYQIKSICISIRHVVKAQ